MQDFDAALKYIDFLFPYFPDYESFSLHGIMKKNLSQAEFNEAYENDAIEILLVNRLLYAKYSSSSKLYILLEDLGREVKKAGGHTKYLDNKNIKEKRKQELEQLHFQQLDYSVQELHNKLSDYGQVKSRSKRSELYAIIAIIVSLISIVLQWIYNKHG